MSAQPAVPGVPPDHVTIEINGQSLVVPKNSMIIQAADKAGIAIPRFCYHKKLPIAANCRECMVEIEMGGRMVPKPAPACATPVADGMRVWTQSAKALAGQRNALEFLLINHPLDCPICDQGGECELQDLTMGFGRSVSRFVERKRTIADEDLGPLVATEMTRCIHCTRCVRVMAEIAGTHELGGMERGERLQIGTYVGKPLMSELSGNVIDVCPVGALTNKPFRFKARAWELIAREGIGYHDALGSNLWLHTRRGEVLRTVPRDNEAINECWLSDRDRYSHEGLQADDRATRPLIRKDGALVEVGWDEAIAFVANGLRAAQGEVGALVAPLASNEEGHLLGRILRGLGSDAIDHRLRVQDFADAPFAQRFQMPVAQVEKARQVLLIGCNPRHEMPLLHQRLRKAWKAGAQVHALNLLDFDFTFEPASKSVLTPPALVEAVLDLAKAANDLGHLPQSTALARLIEGRSAGAAATTLAKLLFDAGSDALILLGETALNHPRASAIRAAAHFLAKASRAACNEIPSGANAIGLAHAGAQPRAGGPDAAAMLARPPRTFVVYQAGSQDTSAPAAFDAARSNAQFCVYIGAYACNGVRRTAHAVLPIGLPPEVDGSYTNVDGTTQVLAAGAQLPGEAKAGWRVLRALGAALSMPQFDFVQIDELRAQMAKADAPMGAATGRIAEATAGSAAFTRVATTAIYRSDQVVRRAASLQAHPLTRAACVTLNPQDALALGLGHGGSASVSGVSLPVEVSASVPRGAAWIEAGLAATRAVPPHGATVDIAKA
ncbi:MAG: NADH-quinone oxidoreductase subunit NuoG [Dokdonella sp.]|nr:NADH-quinone oxidoreductase subunit NuoG [Dokdonella sp.]